MINLGLNMKSSLRKIANKICGREIFAPMSLADGLKSIKKKFGAVGQPSGFSGYRWYNCKNGTTLKIEYTHPDKKPFWAVCQSLKSNLSKGKLENLTELNITQQKPGSDNILCSMHKRVLATTVSPQHVEGVKSVVIKPQGEFTHPSAFTTTTKYFSYNPHNNIFS